MVAEAVDIAKETYFAILMDRAAGGPIILASPMGGMDIEAVARDHPEQLLIVRVKGVLPVLPTLTAFVNRNELTLTKVWVKLRLK